jgi:hypothetical protein
MHPTRRRVLQGVAAVTATAVAPPLRARAQAASPARKAIPSSGEAIPVIGLGTWITFNVGDDPVLRDECADVMGASQAIIPLAAAMLAIAARLGLDAGRR